MTEQIKPKRKKRPTLTRENLELEVEFGRHTLYHSQVRSLMIEAALELDKFREPRRYII